MTSIDWDRRFAWVEPAEGEGRSRWLGTGQPLSADLCDAIRDVLAGTDPAGVTLTTRASEALEEIRSSFRWVRPGTRALALRPSASPAGARLACVALAYDSLS